LRISILKNGLNIALAQSSDLLDMQSISLNDDTIYAILS
jgi:hypothetical protein